MSLAKTLYDAEDKRFKAMVIAWTKGFEYFNYSELCKEHRVRTLDQYDYADICSLLDREQDINLFGGDG